MNASDPNVQETAETLWARTVASFPDDPRNDLEPFATGVE
jgi:hypothetical protein